MMSKLEPLGTRMFIRYVQTKWRVFSILAVVVLACASVSSASATLLLEEPYGAMGFFTATGHAAVYLSGVCAETPIVLRRCAAGETGAVLSRYDGVAGYDWVAIPLVPYLYAVERREDIPLFADAKMVAFLRDHYRRTHLEDLVPDANAGEVPGGNWYELVGSSYDRTIYGFEIETTAAQDDALIRKLNSSPNVSQFHIVSNNCADFAKHLLNSYFPKSLHRSIVADVGMTTPKQLAKMLARFSDRHPELESSRLVISQVPGGMPRSAPVHGVVESFLKSKKYIVPSAVVSPIFAGCVAAVYVGTGAGRFEPARNAMVFVVGSGPERPLGREDRRAYQEQLKHYLAEAYPETSGKRVDRTWEKLQSQARAEVDERGRPVLQMQVDGSPVLVGATAENISANGAPPRLVRQLLEARLQSELRRGSQHGITESEIARDWKLLQQTMPESDEPLTARSGQRAENNIRGNRR
jgi:hypothetical protein